MYTINGALGSPYSMKMRALMRYRRIPHLWVHGADSRDALSKVKAPVIPVMEYPDGTFHNDSTPLIYDLEARHSERSVIPADPAHAFIAHLIEDFADEWVTKAMFGYRWLEEVDQIQMSRWLAFDAMKGGGLATSQGYAEQFRARQIGRMAIVGCTAENFPLIESSTRAILGALEAHVVDQHCLFGTRPSIAEFGMYGQLSQLGVDPTAQAMMRKVERDGADRSGQGRAGRSGRHRSTALVVPLWPWRDCAFARHGLAGADTARSDCGRCGGRHHRPVVPGQLNG